MSLQIRNGISEELARRASIVRDLRPVLQAMGTEFVSLSKRAFTDAQLRPAPWANLAASTVAKYFKEDAKKKSFKGRRDIDGKLVKTAAAAATSTFPATLRRSGRMFQSIRVTEVTSVSVTAGSDAKQAAIHQLGGKTGRGGKVIMPARPFFPILNGKLTPYAEERISAVGLAKIQELMK